MISIKDQNSNPTMSNTSAELPFSFDDLFELSPDALAVFSRGTIVAINSKACEMFGYSQSEMLRKEIIEQIVPEDHILEIMNNIYSRSSHSYILDARRKTGEVISVGMETNHMFYVNENYRLCTFCNLSTVTNFTKDTEFLSKATLFPANSILGQKEKFELLFNVSFNAFAVHVDGCVIEINDMFTQLYGYSKSELLGADIYEIGFPDKEDRRRYKEHLKTKPHSHILMKQVRKDGTMFDAEVRGDFGIINGQKVRVVTIKDISDLVRSEMQLLESNKMLVEKNHELQLVSEEVVTSQQSFYKTLVAERGHIKANVLKGVVIYGKYEYNIRTQTLSLSDEIRDIFEYADTEISNPNAELLGYLEEDYSRLVTEADEAIRTRSLLKIELRVTLKGGRVKYVLVQGVVNSNNDEASSIVGTVLDVTDRKEIENQLRIQNSYYLKLNEDLVQSQKKAIESERLKTSFFSNMSHEIRTPMNGILGFSSLLLDRDLPVDERLEYAEIISDAGKRLLHIVNDILDISKLESDTVKMQYSDVNVNFSLMKMLKLFNKDKKVLDGSIKFKLFKGLSDDLSIIRTDDTRFNQILFNLLSNAFKFTQSGSISLGYLIKKDALCFYVKDTGIGVPANMQTVIFEPFRQVEGHLVKQHGGTGLGLSISKRLAALMGGEMFLESVEGEGSMFSFVLPYKGQSVKSVSHGDKSKSTDETLSKTNESLKLLIAEDDDVNFMFFKSFLGSKLNILRAKNGVEAVELVNANRDIDIVLMDVKMPLMSGLEALKLIKVDFPDLPIIVQTAYAMADDKREAFAAGADDYVSKPINRRELLKKIKALCSDR